MCCFLSSVLEKSEELKEAKWFKPALSCPEGLQTPFFFLDVASEVTDRYCIREQKRSVLCRLFSKKEMQTQAGSAAAHGSRVCWGQLTCEPGKSCTERGRDTCQAAGHTKLQVQLTCYSAPVWFGFYTLLSGAICCFLPAEGWVDLCGTPKEITTSSFTAVHPCNSPTAVPHRKGSRHKRGALLSL